jgi:hypothetical protein
LGDFLLHLGKIQMPEHETWVLQVSEYFTSLTTQKCSTGHLLCSITPTPSAFPYQSPHTGYSLGLDWNVLSSFYVSLFLTFGSTVV